MKAEFIMKQLCFQAGVTCCKAIQKSNLKAVMLISYTY